MNPHFYNLPVWSARCQEKCRKRGGKQGVEHLEKFAFSAKYGTRLIFLDGDAGDLLERQADGFI